MERIRFPVDEDWFAIPSNNMRGLAGLTITDFPADLIVESYSAVLNFEVSRIGSVSNGGTLPVRSRKNYPRIKESNAFIMWIEDRSP